MGSEEKGAGNLPGWRRGRNPEEVGGVDWSLIGIASSEEQMPEPEYSRLLRHHFSRVPGGDPGGTPGGVQMPLPLPLNQLWVLPSPP